MSSTMRSRIHNREAIMTFAEGNALAATNLCLWVFFDNWPYCRKQLTFFVRSGLALKLGVTLCKSFDALCKNCICLNSFDRLAVILLPRNTLLKTCCKQVVLNLFSTTPPLSNCLLFQDPLISNKCIGRNTFPFKHFTCCRLKHARARYLWKFIDASLGRHAPLVKNHCCKQWSWKLLIS